MAANPITYAEMAAYSGLHGLRMSAFEISVLRRLDDVSLAVGRESRQSGDAIEPGDVAGVKGLLKGLKPER